MGTAQYHSNPQMPMHFPQGPLFLRVLALGFQGLGFRFEGLGVSPFFSDPKSKMTDMLQTTPPRDPRKSPSCKTKVVKGYIYNRERGLYRGYMIQGYMEHYYMGLKLPPYLGPPL